MGKLYKWGLSLTAFLILWLLTAESSPAGYISIETTLSLNVKGKTLEVMVYSTNKGDESAYNVQAEISAMGSNIFSRRLSELKVNEGYKVSQKLPITLDKHGTYPVILTLHYTDANQYPFSAITCQTFTYSEELLPMLVGDMESISISDKGKIRLTLKNLTDKRINGRTYLVTPKELTVSQELRQININPKAMQSLGFTIKNLSALHGSTYTVYAISEVEDRHIHYTSLSSGAVKIVHPKRVFGLSYIVIITLLVITCLIFLYLQFLRRRSRKSKMTG